MTEKRDLLFLSNAAAAQAASAPAQRSECVIKHGSNKALYQMHNAHNQYVPQTDWLTI